MKKSMLFTTIAMIVVVVVALSTATFAWFSSAGQATIDGNLTIVSSREFVVKQYDGGWKPVETLTLETSSVNPVSCIKDPTLAASVFFESGANVDAEPIRKQATEENANEFYTVKQQGSSFVDSTFQKVTVGGASNTGAAVVNFQIQNGLADAMTNPKAIIEISADQTAAGAEAISSMRVLLQITEYNASTGLPETPVYIGTNSQWGQVTTTGEVTKPSLIAGNVTAISAQNLAATASLVESPNKKMSEFEANSASKLPLAASGYFNYTGAEAEKQNKLIRVVNQTMVDSFEAGATILVTAHIWLDGLTVSDVASAKTVNVKISFSAS